MVEFPTVDTAVGAQAKSREVALLEARQRELNAQIELIESFPDEKLPRAIKARLTLDLLGSFTNGGSLNLANLIAQINNEINTELAREAAHDVIEHSLAVMSAVSSYPDYAEYSHEGRAYIRDRLTRAYAQSKTLRELEHEYSAIASADKEAAETQAKSNWKEFRELREDSDIQRQYKDQLVLMQGLHVPSTPEGAHIMQMMRQGDNIDAELNALMDKQAVVTQQVLAEIMPNLEGASQEYLKAYGNPADARKMVEEWAKIPAKDRDKAYKAFADHKGVIAKLTPDQQKIVHLSTVMVASDAAQVFSAGIEMVKDKQLEKQLTNTELSVEARANMLKQYMKTHGITAWDRENSAQFAEEFIEVLDKNPSAIELMRTGQLDKVGALYKAEISEDLGLKDGANYTEAGVRYNLKANAEADAPRWVANDPTKLAAYNEQQSVWKQLLGEWNTPATPTVAPHPFANLGVLPPLGGLGVREAAPTATNSEGLVASLSDLGVTGGIALDVASPTGSKPAALQTNGRALV